MSKELKESKKLEKFIEEMRKKKHDVTYNHNDDLLKDIETVLQALKDSIPKEIVEDKIKELKKAQSIELKGLKGQDRYFVKQIYESKINTLQEMLEVNK